MSNPPSRLATGSHARFLLCLLALATVLRALVPVGYMPDAAALRQAACKSASARRRRSAQRDDGADGRARAIPGHVRHVRDVRSTRRRTRRPADDAAQECRSGWWRTRPWTCRRCPICRPCPPPPWPRSPPAPLSLPPRSPARRWGAPRLSVPGLIARSARAARFSGRRTLRLPFAALRRIPGPRPRARRRHARGRPTCKDRDAPSCRTRVSNFPAPWRWPRPWPPSFRRPRPAGARLRHGSGGHHRRRADSPLTFITNPKTPRQPLPASDGTDYLKTIPGSAIRNGGTNGDPVLRGMFGSRLNILTNGSAMPGACPARMDAPSSYISPETFDQLTVIKGPQTVLGPRRLGRHRALRPRHAALHRGRRALRRQPDRRLVRPQ